jgi:hypothetical protein
VYVDLAKALGVRHGEPEGSVGGAREVRHACHFVNNLLEPHVGAVANVKIGEKGTAAGSSVDVRQGACEGPIRERFNCKRGVASFELLATVFADDFEIFTETREGIIGDW